MSPRVRQGRSRALGVRLSRENSVNGAVAAREAWLSPAGPSLAPEAPPPGLRESDPESTRSRGLRRRGSQVLRNRESRNLGLLVWEVGMMAGPTGKGQVRELDALGA